MFFSCSRKIVYSACLLMVTALMAPLAMALEGSWYIGIGGGVSVLKPDTDGSTFTLDNDQSTATSIYVGRDINDWLGVEAAFTDLGEATLSEDETIGYTSASLGAIAYVFGQRDVLIRQDGLSAYVRLGINVIDNDASIDLNSSDNTAAWFGAGIQWPLGDQWGLRAEVASFDGDAQAAIASLYWRLQRDAGSPRAQRIKASQAPVAKPPEPRVDRPAAQIPAPLPRPEPQRPPVTRPRIADSATCSVPAVNEPRDSNGCGLFSGILAGVQFVQDTTQLTTVADTRLTDLAASLARHPGVVIEIQVHTESLSTPEQAMTLSRQRAIAVARNLAGKGVNVKRLRARAFGDTQPRSDNTSRAGRQLNNRVSLAVLP